MTCSMLCGSTQLWPQPTGPVTLGSKALMFYASQLYFESDGVSSGPVAELLQRAFVRLNDTIVNMENHLKESNEMSTSTTTGKNNHSVEKNFKEKNGRSEIQR